MKAVGVFHYCKEDTECDGDYYSVDLMIDGEKVYDTGVEGAALIAGFLNGVEWAAKTKLEYEEVNVADTDC